MTRAAIDALHQEVGRARELFSSLTAEEWAAASGCDGWRVQDVAQHMAALFQQIADASSIDVGDSGKAEVSAEVPVQSRRGWAPEQVVAGYDEWSEKGVAALTALQDPPLADTEAPILDLGTYPLHMIANSIVFDHYCHLRHDIGAAVERAARLPRDDGALAVVVDWMLAGLPQMCAATLAAAPPQPVDLVIDGPGAGTYTLSPGPDGWTVATGADDDPPLVRTTAHDFVAWGTKRADWRHSCTGDVDNPKVAAVLDAINII